MMHGGGLVVKRVVGHGLSGPGFNSCSLKTFFKRTLCSKIESVTQKRWRIKNIFLRSLIAEEQFSLSRDLNPWTADAMTELSTVR